jgi:hypothetical protein
MDFLEVFMFNPEKRLTNRKYFNKAEEDFYNEVAKPQHEVLVALLPEGDRPIYRLGAKVEGADEQTGKDCMLFVNVVPPKPYRPRSVTMMPIWTVNRVAQRGITPLERLELAPEPTVPMLLLVKIIGRIQMVFFVLLLVTQE